MIDNIFPPIELTDTEIDVVVEHLSNPAVMKYLKSLGQISAKEGLTLSISAMTSDQIAMAEARVQGRLETLATLLSISKSKE